MAEPYNEWLPAHNAQGFSWRPGSVSFATTVDRGICELVAEVGDAVPPLNDAKRAIAVPFEVPSTGTLEMGSIMTGVQARLAPGSYRLVFIDYGEAKRVRLVFIPGAGGEPDVLRADELVEKQSQYLMSAKPG